MSAVTRDVRWWELAKPCDDVDPEVMHPPVGSRALTLVALKVCRGCPVVAGCLREALDLKDVDGVRGGLTGDDRERVLDGRSPLTTCPRCKSQWVPKSHTKTCRQCVPRADPRVARPRESRAAGRVEPCPECTKRVGFTNGRRSAHWRPGESRMWGHKQCTGGGKPA